MVSVSFLLTIMSYHFMFAILTSQNILILTPFLILWIHCATDTIHTEENTLIMRQLAVIFCAPPPHHAYLPSLLRFLFQCHFISELLIFTIKNDKVFFFLRLLLEYHSYRIGITAIQICYLLLFSSENINTVPI